MKKLVGMRIREVGSFVKASFKLTSGAQSGTQRLSLWNVMEGDRRVQGLHGGACGK